MRFIAWIWILGFPIFSLGLPLVEGEDITSTSEHRIEIERLLESYAEAYENRNPKQLRRCVSAQMWSQIRSGVADQPRPASPLAVRIKSLRLVRYRDHLYAQFDYQVGNREVPMNNENWFEIARTGENPVRYQIVQFHTEFNP